MLDNSEYDEWEAKRDKGLKYIVQNLSNKNILVAGPGTGKTFAFKQVCKELKPGEKIIVLSFINELVRDLSKNLASYTDSISTLHSFALSITSGRKIYLGLDELINDDYLHKFNKKINFSKKFHNLEMDDESYAYYLERKSFYKHESPNSIVYLVLSHFSSNPNKIPTNIKLILVDEYQDFNKLEAKFIDVLSSKTNILIVGDDEQALYTDLRDAKPELIRDKYRDENWSSFQLPYCSRCTKVIVEAYNQILYNAVKEGFFKDRIQDKKYIYFRSKKKDQLSELYPKIVFKKLLVNKAGLQAFYVKDEINKLYKTDPDSDFNVLVICTNNIQVKNVAKSLKKQGFTSVLTNKDNLEPKLEKIIKAFDLIIQNDTSNLGWRLVSELFLSADRLKQIIDSSHEEGKKIIDLLSETEREKLNNIVDSYKKIIKNHTTLTEESLDIVLELFEIDPKADSKELISKRHDKVVGFSKNPFSDTPIKVTTMTGSKGLSYDYVFMMNFSDEMILERGKPSDSKISNFLVALSRAKKRAYLTTNVNTKPLFLKWVSDDLIDERQ